MKKINPDILKKALDNLDAPEEVDLDSEQLLVANNVMKAIKLHGKEISLSQAAALWRDYSFNNFAGWMVGGETVEEANSAIADYCNDIEYGENHIGL